MNPIYSFTGKVLMTVGGTLGGLHHDAAPTLHTNPAHVASYFVSEMKHTHDDEPKPEKALPDDPPILSGARFADCP